MKRLLLALHCAIPRSGGFGWGAADNPGIATTKSQQPHNGRRTAINLHHELLDSRPAVPGYPRWTASSAWNFAMPSINFTGTGSKNTKVVVKVNRGGTLNPEYVQRIDRVPIQMTSDRKLALLMGS
jgi:hypothetical protein